MKRMIEILYRSIACAAKVYFKVGSQEQRAIYFRKSLIELGPAFVKFGQVLSTRADVLPRSILRRLKRVAGSNACVRFIYLRRRSF